MKTKRDALMWDIVYTIAAIAIFVLGVVYILYTALATEEGQI